MLLAALLIGGCTTSRGGGPVGEPVRPRWGQEQVAAGALVFDPPVARAEPAVNLPRGPRQASAFVGFDELTTTFFSVRVNDRHTADWTDRYERRAVMEQVGVRHR
jgi:hypothetical protein